MALSLVKKLFVDSVNFIVHICNKKKQTNISVFTAERNSQVISVVNFIPSKFETCPQVFWKAVLHTRLSVCKESAGDSWFVTNNLLVYYKWSVTHALIPFPL